MKGEEQQIRKAIDEIADQMSSGLSKKTAEILDNVLVGGVLPKEALGLTDEKIEGIYGQAYRLYNTGKYVEAIQLFRILSIIDPTESKYALGLAACFHMMKEYENAIRIYTLAGIIDGNNPVPSFHASDCFIQMRDSPSAILALEMAVQRAGNRPEFQMLKERALLSIESLKKEIEKKKT